MSALIEQQRARFALDRVAAWKSAGQLSDNMKAAANSLPALILMNGLGQAAAYAKSQKEGKNGHWKLLYNALSDWLCGESGIHVYGSTGQDQDLLAALTRGSMAEYRLAQAEALAFLQWLKNAVRAEMAED